MKSGKNKNVGIAGILWHKCKYVAIVLTTVALLIGALTGCGEENKTASTSSSVASQADVSSSLSSQASSDSSSQESSQAPLNVKSVVKNYTNDQGYSYSVTVKIWDPIQNAKVGKTTHPDYSANVLQSSSFNASTDLVVPAAFVIQNTTKQFSIPVSIAADMTEISASDERVHTYPDVTVEQFFSNPEDTNIPSSPVFSVQWNNPLTPNQTAKQDFFVIIHNYYTPKTPQGDTTLLDRIGIHPVIISQINQGYKADDWRKGIFLSGKEGDNFDELGDL